MSLPRSFLLAGLASIAIPASALAQAPQINCDQNYVVVAGDSLSKISRQAYGSFDFQRLYDANRATVGANPDRIFVGQVLFVPCAAATAVVVAEVSDTPPETAEAPATPLILTFNKGSGDNFIINSGIIDIYLAQITEVTEGRVQFVAPAEVNRNPEVQLDLVTSGQVDGAYVFNGFLAESHPLLQLPMTPLMGGSAEQTAVSLWNLHENHLAATSYFDEAQLMGFVAAPAAHIWRLDGEPAMAGSDMAVTNNYAVPYFAGLDTRGPAAVRAEVETQLMAMDEANNGTLTFFMAHGAARATGVWTPERTVTEVDNGLYTPTFSVVLSHEAWAQISEEDRAAISEISGEYLAHRSASWDVFDNGHRSHMITTGLKAVKADDGLMSELRAFADMRNAEWVSLANAAGVDGEAALAAYEVNLAELQDLLLFR